MSTPETPKPAEEAKKTPITDPYVLLESLGGPTREQIEYQKQSSPNGHVRIFTPDVKRVFLLRRLGAARWKERSASRARRPDEPVPPKTAEQSGAAMPHDGVVRRYRCPRL